MKQRIYYKHFIETIYLLIGVLWAFFLPHFWIYLITNILNYSYDIFFLNEDDLLLLSFHVYYFGKNYMKSYMDKKF